MVATSLSMAPAALLGPLCDFVDLDGPLLLERDRLGHLPGIVSCYRRLLNDAKGRVDAKVVSANALEPAMVERVRVQLRAISGKEVILQQVVEPDLLGGLQVELEGKIYDGSLRTQLEKMKQRIARGY